MQVKEIKGIHPGALAKLERCGVRPVFTHRRMAWMGSRWYSKKHDLPPMLVEGNEGRYNVNGTVDPRGGETVCKLVNAGNEVVATGVAVCHPEDNYVKETGRTLALNRAMKQLP